ncbi:hypothetical protein G5B40_15350 [Pikeienuella piscinae]|uniref:Uncharacterized protein n=1 Tax=Pikeienuella piscinae TaxID=2748098 RepID=A0A7L5BXN2_9RHOB|nr:hypothetical protein G5B40_15350 [Pikeienuella piscinae]
MTKRSPFRYFKTNPSVIRLAMVMYVRYSWSLRSVGYLLLERGVYVIHETTLKNLARAALAVGAVGAARRRCRGSHLDGCDPVVFRVQGNRAHAVRFR